MKRRRLLAGLATGLTAGFAGCGYAPGGGDVREETSILTGLGGLGGSNLYDRERDRIAAARSGQQWVGEFGDRSFETATTVRITDLNGETLGAFTHSEASVDVSLGNRIYLLDDVGRVVAADQVQDGGRETDSSEEEAVEEIEESWRVELDDPKPPTAADDGGTYVSDGNDVVAIRDGTVVWNRDLGGPVETLRAIDGIVLVSTGTKAVALNTDGGTIWEFEIDGPATFATADERTVLRGRGDLFDGDDLAVVRTADGDVRWSTTTRGGNERPAIADGRVYVVGHGTVAAYDLANGEIRWEARDVGVEPPVVAASEGVYSLGESCEAVAVDADGERWTRPLDRQSCSIVDGWIDGETVAFLLNAGGIVWFQRVDEEPGLLW